jgi:hypothetical protein
MFGQHLRRQPIQISAACILVFLVAVTLRTTFVREMLNQYQQFPPNIQKSFRYGFLTADSRSYIESAGRIAEGDLLNAGSLSRPPGYPLFLWACGRVSSRVLTMQAVLGALIPVCTFLLSFLVARNVPVSVVAGMISAVSPTGTGVTGLVLPDLLLAALFVLSVLLLLIGTSKEHIGWLVSSALVVGLAGLVKPVLLLWPFASVAVWWFFRRAHGRSVTWLHALPLVVIPGTFFLGWASCNYSRDGVFSVSDKGPQTVRVYWAAAVDEWGKSNREPSSQAIRTNQAEIRQRLANLPPPARMRMYREESLEIFSRYPALTIVVILTNVKEPAIQGWDYFHLQLPLDPSLLSKLQWMSTIESSVRKWIRWPIMLAFLSGILAVRFSPSSESRQMCLLICGVSVAYFYFALMSGVTFWTGPRVVYPIESVALTILAAGVVLGHTIIRTMRARQPSGNAPAPPPRA